MTIKRFEVFAGKDEYLILDECGYPEANSIINFLPFWKANENLVFLFVDEEDVDWIEGKDALSIEVYDKYNNKGPIAGEIFRKPIVVFIKGKEGYVFYGVYNLENPYVSGGGLEGVFNPETPLIIRFDTSYCKEEDMICF